MYRFEFGLCVEFFSQWTGGLRGILYSLCAFLWKELFKKMKDGDRVKDRQGREGTSKGPAFYCGVWWILVEFDDPGSTAYVLEEYLEKV